MNKRFGKVCVATAGALGAAVSVLSAGPALAADQSVTIANCNWREGDEFGPYTLGVGDTLTVTFTTPGNCAIARADADMDFGTLTVTDTNGGTRILTAGQEYAPGSSSIASLAFEATQDTGGASDTAFQVRNGGGEIWWARFNVLVSGEGSPGGGEGEPEEPSAAQKQQAQEEPLWWLLAIPRTHPDDICPDGWSPSWAQWPNGNRGGWVCEKSVPRYGLPTSSRGV